MNNDDDYGDGEKRKVETVSPDIVTMYDLLYD